MAKWRVVPSVLLALAVAAQARTADDALESILSDAGLTGFTEEQRKTLAGHVETAPPRGKDAAPADVVTFALQQVPQTDAAVRQALANDPVLNDFLQQALEEVKTGGGGENTTEADDLVIQQFYGKNATPRDVLTIGNLTQLADRYRQEGQYEKAAALFWAARQRVPPEAYQHWMITDDIARCLMQQGKLDEVVRLVLETETTPNVAQHLGPALVRLDTVPSLLFLSFKTNAARTGKNIDDEFLLGRCAFLFSNRALKESVKHIRAEASEALLAATYLVDRPVLDEDEAAWLDSAAREWRDAFGKHATPLPQTDAFFTRVKPRLTEAQQAQYQAVLGRYEEAALLAARSDEQNRQSETIELLRKILLLATGDPRSLLPDGEKLKDIPWSRDTKVAVVRRLRRSDPTGDTARLWIAFFLDFAFGSTSPEQIGRLAETLRKDVPPEEYLDRLGDLYQRQSGASREAVMLAILQEAGGDADPGQTVRALQAQADQGARHAALFRRLAVEYAFRKEQYRPAIDLANAMPEDQKGDRTFLVLALSHMQLDEEAEALRALDELLARWPDAPSAERAYFMKGYLEFTSGHEDEAGKNFFIVTERWPRGTFAARAKSFLDHLENFAPPAAPPAPAHAPQAAPAAETPQPAAPAGNGNADEEEF